MLLGAGVTSFTPDEDLTLRQVFIVNGSVSTDPTRDGSLPYGVSADTITEFYLDSATGYPVSQLAFPVPQGTPIFYANAAGAGEATLIFS